ncbi:TauD/TfdA dioxygenase family protein [Nocardioides alcanivorans]|uniref:TauD/TfdA dioxygenase family protein n=1 Tax=Nocardioides alcanivorans TaxID=2897352 RepID=UPI0024B054BC|nr:TauD/TfdA family dioxygenase [Nocardioides alcanivorans]
MAFMFATPTDPLSAFGPLVAERVPEAFESKPFEHLRVSPMTPTIGAEVSGVRLSGEIGPEVLEELRRALLEWKLLVFRDQDIDRSEHRAFAELWGELEQHPFFKYTQPGQSDVDVATLAKDMDTAGVENNWHNDVTWHTTPSYAAVLRAVEIPPVGGDTLWADAGAPTTCCPTTSRSGSTRWWPSTTGSTASAPGWTRTSSRSCARAFLPCSTRWCV